MRSAISLVLLCGILLVTLGCRSDRFVEPPPSLQGQYVGFYSIKFTGQVEEQQPITWAFSNVGFRMKLDTANGNPSRQFCDCLGSYIFESGSATFDISNPNLGADLCSEDKNPSDKFAVFQPSKRPEVPDPPVDSADSAILDAWDDTLRLEQSFEGGTKTLKLVRTN